MRIGIFDSGLGGLVIAQAIQQLMPEYDYVYFGDTLNVPYGGRSKQAIYAHTEKSIDYLMRVKQCSLVIIACNTATAHCARMLQQFYLPRAFPNNRILGVVIPTLEFCIDAKCKNIGLLATAGLVESLIYQEELMKLDSTITLHGQSAPLLVPMIENNGQRYIAPILDTYLEPLIKQNIDGLILGCTHYPVLKSDIQDRVGNGVKLISQDDIIPRKLHHYLLQNKPIENQLTKNSTTKYMVSDITNSYQTMAQSILGCDIHLEKASV